MVVFFILSLDYPNSQIENKHSHPHHFQDWVCMASGILRNWVIETLKIVI